MIVTYRDRHFLDRFRCIDTVRSFRAISSFVQGGLTYFRVDRYNYKVIETNFIISVEEVTA